MKGFEDDGVPSRIETERLVLRSWTATDAVMAREAVDTSLAHLRRFVAWAWDQPISIDKTRALLQGFAQRFEAGEGFSFGVFNQDESEVVGGCELQRSIGEGGLELAYWIRIERTRAGFATEAAQAVTDVGLSLPGVDRIQAHCDALNEGSRRVAERVGFRLIETRVGARETPDGELRDTLVYEIRKDSDRAN